MIRRILLSLLVGAAVVALDRPDRAGEMAKDAREAARFCAAVPFLCRHAADAVMDGDALPIGDGSAYVGADAKIGE